MNKIDISIIVPNRESLKDFLVDRDNFLRERINLSEKVSIVPLFSAIESDNFTGSEEILPFVLNFVSSIGASVIASLLFNFLKKANVKKVKITDKIIELDDKGCLAIIERQLEILESNE